MKLEGFTNIHGDPIAWIEEVAVKRPKRALREFEGFFQ